MTYTFRYNASSIPKIIWLYWNDTNLPPLEKSCYERIKKLHPDFKIILINMENEKEYVPDDVFKIKHAQSSLQKRANYIRAWVLKEHGGIWIDMASYLNKRITFCRGVDCDLNSQHIQLNNDYEFNGYYLYITEDDVPFVENWFIAVKKHSVVMKYWWDEMVKIDSYETIKDWQNAHEGLNYGGVMEDYLTMHQAMLITLRKYPQLKNKMYLKPAINGPLKLAQMCDWDMFGKNVKLMQEQEQLPYIKIRKYDKKSKSLDFLIESENYLRFDQLFIVIILLGSLLFICSIIKNKY